MRNRFSSAPYVSAALLSFLISWGGISSIVTAYSLGCRSETLLLFCAGLSLAVPLLFFPRKPRLVFSLFWLALLGTVLRFHESLLDSRAYALSVILDKLSSAYRFVYPSWLIPAQPAGTDCTSIALLLEVLLSLCVCWTVIRRETLLPVLSSCALVLTICVLDLSSFPALFSILALLLGLLILCLTQSVRRRSSSGHRLTLILFLPAALFLCLLLIVSSYSDYERSNWSDTLEERLSNALTALPFLQWEDDRLTFSVGNLFAPSAPTAVNLGAVGPKANTGQQVMSVLADSTGTLYLRGASMGDYTGTAWRSLSDSDHRNASLSQWNPEPLWQLLERRSVALETETLSKVLYLPYDAGGVFTSQGAPTGAAYYDAYWRNTGDEFSYTAYYSDLGWDPVNPNTELLELLDLVSVYFSTDFSDVSVWMDGSFKPTNCKANFDSMLDWQEANASYTAFAEEAYTQLPYRTRHELEKLLEDAGLSQNNHPQDLSSWAAQAFAIADYVRSSAEYDLNTPRMPGGQDFVLWFLTKSDTGYCVHFASATVALLRAAGIPARYVTGFAVNTVEGQWTPVTTDQAHAWAEFYLPGLGWVPLEATPGAAVEVMAGPDGAAEETAPPTTEIPSVPTTEPSATESSATEATSSKTPSAPATEGSVPSDSQAAASSAEPAPSGGPGIGSRILGFLKTAARILAPPAALVLLLFLQRRLRLILLSRRLRDPDPNRRVIALYLHLERLADAAGESLPEELTELVGKARFSQHCLTAGEILPLQRIHRELLEKLRQQGPLRRFRNRYLRVLY